jgi:hypothetical protein
LPVLRGSSPRRAAAHYKLHAVKEVSDLCEVFDEFCTNWNVL